MKEPEGRKTGLSVLTLLLFFLIVCPLIMVFAKAVIYNGRLDFGTMWLTLAEKKNLTMIAHSLLLGVLVVIVSTVIAAPLAYLMARTSFAKYRFLDIVFMIPFMTPPYIASMGWILFMQKRGLLQQLLPQMAGAEKAFFTLGGLVLVMSLHVFPFMLSILKNAMLNIPNGLDEAGSIFGAGFSRRLVKILMPLLRGNYAIGALLVFVKTISEYGTPSTLGRRIGFDVFTTEIHRYATVAPIEFGKAATLSSVLIGICLCMWMLQNDITTRKSYHLVGGKGVKTVEKTKNPAAVLLGWLYIVFVLVFAVGIPYFSILSTSLIKLRGYGFVKGNFTLQHYIELFTENTKGVQALTNSLILAVSSATICAALGTVLVVAVRKTKRKMGRLVEAMGLLPEMLPGIVLVIGIMLFWNQIYQILPLYNTLGIMVLAYVVLFLPYTIQYVTSSFTQISPSLVTAGQVFGGTPIYIFRKITFPLLRKGIVTGWMMTFIIAFRELVTASLIAPPNTLVVSTYIVREFEQGSVSVGMAMAVLCVLFTTTALLLINYSISKQNNCRNHGGKL
ncbi:MAG: ABC transporter permease [Acetatifactor sp.]